MMAIFATASTQAQDAGRIEAGSFDIIPTFSSSLSYLDNVTSSQDDTPQIYSWRATLAPQLTVATLVDSNPVQLTYRAELGKYFSSQDDDYTDHFLAATGDFELNSRHTIDVSARYEDGHEDRGTGLSIGVGEAIATPDTYKSTLFDVNYIYGSITSAGQLTFSASRNTFDYDRTEENYLIRDRFINKLGGEFSYSVSPSTNLVVDVTQSSVRYEYQPLDDSIRDSDVTRVLVGATWESTAATTGFAKVGYQEKDFETTERRNFYGTDWEVGIDWQPIEYSTVRLSTSADTRETNGEGDLIRSRDYAVSWNHDWYDYLSTSVGVTTIDNIYVLNDDTIIERTDDFTIYTMSASYQARRWLSISFFYEYSELSSNRDTLGYDRSNVGVSFEVTL